MIIKLEIGQTWTSKTHPHENFKIYDIIIQEWDNAPTDTYYCWERLNNKEFLQFVADQKCMKLEEFLESNKNTFPYSWAGESKKSYLAYKIKKFNMELQ
jgi:hypothetical protein